VQSLSKQDKEDEQLFRQKEEYISNTQRKLQKKLEKQQQKVIIEEQEEQEEEIVGIAKPQGFWTYKIFAERLGAVMEMSKTKKTGFWTAFVKSKRVSVGKGAGRR
jgi:hypothetical protein